MHPQFITLNGRSKDITSQRFGRLVALGPVAKTDRNQIVWLCMCDCNTTTTSTFASLNAGSTQSCGCIHRETLVNRNQTHGMAKDPLYRTWAGIVKRCTNPNATGYAHYGGRGIAICDEWRHSFEAFYNHVTQLPDYGTKGYSLDRINNNGNYEPDNVRWTTTVNQRRNTRKNIMLTYGDKTQCIAAWAEEIGINVGTLHSRLSRGFPIEQSLTTPVGGLR